MNEVPDHADGIVYVMTHPDNFYKVGVTNDPHRRIATARTFTPYKLSYHTTIPATDKETVEKELHCLLEDYHYSKEWYRLPEPVLDDLAQQPWIQPGDAKRIPSLREKTM